MAKTLLQMVQDILFDMGSFNVNSINDTQESRRVVNIIMDTYETIKTYRWWPDEKEMQPLSNFTTLTVGSLVPDTFRKIEQVFYKGSEIYQVSNIEFIRRAFQINPSYAYAEAVTINGISTYVTTNKPPSYYSVFNINDQDVLVVDSYKIADDPSGVVASSFVCVVDMVSSATPSDSLVFKMPEDVYPYLLAQAKSTCFLLIKQMANPIAQGDAQRLRSFLSMNKGVAKNEDTYPNFGRK